MIDFDAYWASVRADVAASDRDWDRVDRDQTVKANGGEWRIDWIRFSSIDDSLVWAWYAVPKDHAPNGVGMLWLPGYSYGTPPPDATCLIPGVCTLCVNVHGNAPDAVYENPAGKNDYVLQGIDDPASYIYRRIAAHCLRGLAVLAEQAEVSERMVVVGGMSQGGGLSVITAAQTQAVRLCFADMPFLADIRVSLKVSSSPVYKAVKSYTAAHPERADDTVETLRLFDPVRHAPMVNVPTWVTSGGRDPAVKPQTAEAVFQAIGSPVKQYQFYPNTGHVFVAEMNATHAKWIEDYILNQ